MGLLRPSLDIALRRWHLTGACDSIYAALEMQILLSLSLSDPTTELCTDRTIYLTPKCLPQPLRRFPSM